MCESVIDEAVKELEQQGFARSSVKAIGVSLISPYHVRSLAHLL